MNTTTTPCTTEPDEPADLVTSEEQFLSIQTALQEQSPFTLVYVDYRDELSAEQIAAYLAGDWETLDESLEGWDEDRNNTAYDVVDAAITAAGATRDDLTDSEFYTLLDLVMENDDSAPLRDLLRNTPDQLLRATISADLPPIMGFDDGDPRTTRLDFLVGVLAAHGLTPDPDCPELDELVDNGPFDWTDGVQLDVIWYGPIDQLNSSDPVTLTITNPNVLLIDTYAGSGHEVQIQGVLTLPGVRPHLDREPSPYRYGWDEIAGVVKSYYRTDVVISTP